MDHVQANKISISWHHFWPRSCGPKGLILCSTFLCSMFHVLISGMKLTDWFSFLFSLFLNSRIIAKAMVNLMLSQSVGIVFGPTLMWPEMENSNMAVNMMYQNQIIDLILTEHAEIFNPEGL